MDLMAGDLLTVSEDGGVDRLHVGTVAAFHRPRAGGGYVVATERTLAVADQADAQPRVRAPGAAPRGSPLNDGGCSPVGTLYAGSMAGDGSPGGGQLLRVEPSGAAEDGAPDGLTVDADGGVWVALWGGSAVRGYDSHGRLQEVIAVPARQVSACTFGGPA